MAEPEEVTTQTEEQGSPGGTPEESPHPLEQGGERFEQVIAQRNTAREEMEYWKTAYEQAIANQQHTIAQGPLQTGGPVAQGPVAQGPVGNVQKVYTPQELQAYRDAGQISEAQMIEILAYQRDQQLKSELKQELQRDQMVSKASDEVSTYLRMIPDLNKPTSPDVMKVAGVAQEIAHEWGTQVNDPRVMRRALRETYGPVEKLQHRVKSQEFSRAHADTHVESGVGGGGAEGPVKNPLADVPKPLMDYWRKMNYSEERMKEELKFVDRSKWA